MANGARGGHTRQRKTWDVLVATNTLATADATFVGGSITSNVGALTVLRQIGGYLLSPTPGGTFVAGDGCRITLGIGVFAADAFALGIGVFAADAFALGPTAMPEPSQEAEFPWLYWRQHNFLFAGAGPGGDEITAHVRETFDSRSMRKFKAREAVGWVMQYENVSGDLPMTIIIDAMRTLVGQ